MRDRRLAKQVMKRLLTVLSAVSLLLTVGTLVLWARSYWRLDILMAGCSPSAKPKPQAAAVSYRGRLMLTLDRQREGNGPIGPNGCSSFAGQDADETGWYFFTALFSDIPYRAGGFGFRILHFASDEVSIYVYMPIWALAIAT